MKQKLQKILAEIHAIKQYQPELLDNFKKTILYIITLLESYRKQHNNPMLNVWTEMEIFELNKELNNRLNDKFLQYDQIRQQSEFMDSKSIVQLTLNNIIVNINKSGL